jgi:hypothetical protein
MYSLNVHIRFLHSFEDFYRKLGCTMVNHPRGNRSRHRSGRSLIRDRDRATPINPLKDKVRRSQSVMILLIECSTNLRCSLLNSTMVSALFRPNSGNDYYSNFFKKRTSFYIIVLSHCF